MITSITLNAAIDRIYELESVEVGGTNRVSHCMEDAGGKGMNVAKVLQALGADVLVGGFAGGMNGTRIKELLDKRGLPHELIRIAGETRVCLTVLDSSAGEGTELLESGPTILKEEWESMRKWLGEKTKEGDYFVLSGSLPKGLPKSAYAELIEVINANGAKAILDTSGEALLLGMEEKPFAIKPNEQEIAEVLGKKAFTENDLIRFGEKCVNDGIEHICITLGSAGAIFFNKEGCFKAETPKIEVVNPVGSGDAFIGGLAYGMSTGEGIKNTYRRAIACGAVNAANRDIGYVKAELVNKLISEIQVKKING